MSSVNEDTSSSSHAGKHLCIQKENDHYVDKTITWMVCGYGECTCCLTCWAKDFKKCSICDIFMMKKYPVVEEDPNYYCANREEHQWVDATFGNVILTRVLFYVFLLGRGSDEYSDEDELSDDPSSSSHGGKSLCLQCEQLVDKTTTWEVWGFGECTCCHSCWTKDFRKCVICGIHEMNKHPMDEKDPYYYCCADLEEHQWVDAGNVILYVCCVMHSFRSKKKR